MNKYAVKMKFQIEAISIVEIDATSPENALEHAKARFPFANTVVVKRYVGGDKGKVEDYRYLHNGATLCSKEY